MLDLLGDMDKQHNSKCCFNVMVNNSSYLNTLLYAMYNNIYSMSGSLSGKAYWINSSLWRETKMSVRKGWEEDNRDLMSWK